MLAYPKDYLFPLNQGSGAKFKERSKCGGAGPTAVADGEVTPYHKQQGPPSSLPASGHGPLFLGPVSASCAYSTGGGSYYCAVLQTGDLRHGGAGQWACFGLLVMEALWLWSRCPWPSPTTPPLLPRSHRTQQQPPTRPTPSA